LLWRAFLALQLLFGWSVFTNRVAAETEESTSARIIVASFLQDFEGEFVFL
jgi:hypothetical protein